jgi:hypothetical protein
MNNWIYIALLFVSSFAYSQEKKVKGKVLSEKDFQKQVSYERKESYQGPKPSSYNSPASLYDTPEDEGENNDENNRSGGIQFDENQLDEIRQRKGSTSTEPLDGNGGSIQKDPDIRELEEQDYDVPEPSEPPTLKPFELSSGVVTSILIILGVLILIFVLYLIFRNRANRNKRIQTVLQSEAWDPTEISKTELELKLEEAFEKGDYRTCVRIYFTFILKELISSGKIRWKKEYTNYDYLAQMADDAEAETFSKIVSIYDLVWYGEFLLSKEEYLEVQPLLEGYYKRIEKRHE